MTRDRMTVVACAGEGRTRLETRPVPRPSEGELLLRLRACGLCGTDLFKLAARSAEPGTVLGHEVVATVEEVCGRARGVEGEPIRAGDRIVLCHHAPCGECALCRRGSETMCPVFREDLLEPGGFSECILARERAVARTARRLPDDVSDETGSFLEPAACVLRGVRRSGMPSGGTALVLGAGSMGLLHVLVIAAAFPSARIFAVDPIEDRRRLALELGAGAAWAPDEALARARDATSGRGADAVFDTVGGGHALARALDLTREGGTVVLFAHAPPAGKAAIDLNRLFKSERRVVATYSSAPAEQAEVFDLLLSGRLDPSPLVTARLPLERFDEAVERVRARRELKVLITPGEGPP